MPSYILFRHGLDYTILLYMSQSTHSLSSPLHKHWKIISLKSDTARFTSTQNEVDTLMHRFTSTRNEMHLYLITCSTPILNREKPLLGNKLLSTWNRGNAHKLSQCLFLVEFRELLTYVVIDAGVAPSDALTANRARHPLRRGILEARFLLFSMSTCLCASFSISSIHWPQWQSILHHYQIWEKKLSAWSYGRTHHPPKTSSTPTPPHSRNRSIKELLNLTPNPQQKQAKLSLHGFLCENW